MHDHCEIAALTRSEKGSLIVTRDEVHAIDAHPVAKVVDTTGAGDLYAAGFLFGLTHGYDLGTAGRLGALAAGGGDQPPRSAAADVARGSRAPAPRTMKLPRYRTGDPEIDKKVAAIVDEVADPANTDLVFEIVASALRLGLDGADRGDLKIASAALKEMRHAFYVFAPYRTARKVAIFGSARTQPDDPLYLQTRELAAAVAARDWMVVTGAGPGIMEAGIEGAGPEQAFGVSIKLPFEAATTQFFDGDPKLINFRYFFTRKLEFVKESDAFVLLPGGFGTLDEAFELLTLLQTGKAQPAPVVLLDVPGGTYWETWQAFVTEELVNTGYISPR